MDVSDGALPLATAAYLRCHPCDAWGMPAHRHAISRHALQLGLCEPEFFFDNGTPSWAPMPELARLLQAVESGAYAVVLIPGPFVFSLDDAAAEAVVRRIESHACRVLDLPSPGAQAHARTPRPSGRLLASPPGAGALTLSPP
jgi:hypothetical protein